MLGSDPHEQEYNDAGGRGWMRRPARQRLMPRCTKRPSTLGGGRPWMQPAPTSQSRRICCMRLRATSTGGACVWCSAGMQLFSVAWKVRS